MPLVLQLVHISDPHFVTHADGVQRVRNRWSRLFSVLPFTAGGMMGHDATALDRFEEALSYVLMERLLGSGAAPPAHVTRDVKSKTWIVCTGDMSTLGDNNLAVKEGLEWLESVAARKGIEYCSIYGNHDVWAGGVPLDSTDAELEDHRTTLRASRFAGTWPLAPVARGAGQGGRPLQHARVLDVPTASGRRLVVTSLNTTMHEKGPNMLAYGLVREDRYWESATGPDQLPELHSRAGQGELRIVLTHHPVHYPNMPAFGMRLYNCDNVAIKLSAQAKGAPLGTIVLSGHTHDTFPEPNALPRSLPSTKSTLLHPLGRNQYQMIAGTLSQRPHGSAAVTHDFCCLRFYEEDDGSLILEREVWRRDGRTPRGEFKPVAAPGTRNYTEEMALIPARISP